MRSLLTQPAPSGTCRKTLQLLAAALAIWLGAERRASLPAQRSLATVALVLVLLGEMLGRSVFYGLHMTVGL